MRVSYLSLYGLRRNRAAGRITSGGRSTHNHPTSHKLCIDSFAHYKIGFSLFLNHSPSATADVMCNQPKNKSRAKNQNQHMPSLIEHIQISASDFEKSKTFYARLTDWFGFENIGEYEGDDEFPKTIGFLKDGLKILISQAQHEGKHSHGSPGLHHLAFRVETKQDVDRFYSEILEPFKDIEVQNPPIECPEYGDNYYATFFFDPDGIKLEVMYSTPSKFKE